MNPHGSKEKEEAAAAAATAQGQGEGNHFFRLYVQSCSVSPSTTLVARATLVKHTSNHTNTPPRNRMTPQQPQDKALASQPRLRGRLRYGQRPISQSASWPSPSHPDTHTPGQGSGNFSRGPNPACCLFLQIKFSATFFHLCTFDSCFHASKAEWSHYRDYMASKA